MHHNNKCLNLIIYIMFRLSLNYHFNDDTKNVSDRFVNVNNKNTKTGF